MNSAEIRERFLKFFEKRGHKIIPSASLVPENDNSVLFTTAGMQQFKPYFIGLADAKKDFGTLNTASIQRCIRTSDIEEVGDESHLTFFEMLGNFSFGGYWKKDAIQYGYDFITKELGLKIDYVTVFQGEGEVPSDTESEKIWRTIDQHILIKKAGRSDNFWGPTGEEGPCGPTTEIYVDGIEVWNIVFNEYFQNKSKGLAPLKVTGIDTGMGLERLAKVVQKTPTVFETDLFSFGQILSDFDERTKRIILDHSRAVVFLINDGVEPTNKGRGYILRRLLKRIVTHYYLASISKKVPMNYEDILRAVCIKYKDIYPSLDLSRVEDIVRNEYIRFNESLPKGLKELSKMKSIDISNAFLLFESYRLDFDLIKELAPKETERLTREDFEKELKKHQEISRAGAEQKFKGGLADTSDMSVKYHTATHLLNAALREVLGKEVVQKGSNITPERLRFDFSYPNKMTDEQKKAVEDLVNSKIEANLPVSFKEMSKEEAEKTGAVHAFGEKYGDVVKVYSIGDEKNGYFSREFCGGPHVERTGILGHFKITKEEAVSAGVRRIKAVLE